MSDGARARRDREGLADPEDLAAQLRSQRLRERLGEDPLPGLRELAEVPWERLEGQRPRFPRILARLWEDAQAEDVSDLLRWLTRSRRRAGLLRRALPFVGGLLANPAFPHIAQLLAGLARLFEPEATRRGAGPPLNTALEGLVGRLEGRLCARALDPDQATADAATLLLLVTPRTCDAGLAALRRRIRGARGDEAIRRLSLLARIRAGSGGPADAALFEALLASAEPTLRLAAALAASRCLGEEAPPAAAVALAAALASPPPKRRRGLAEAFGEDPQTLLKALEAMGAAESPVVLPRLCEGLAQDDSRRIGPWRRRASLLAARLRDRYGGSAARPLEATAAARALDSDTRRACALRLRHAVTLLVLSDAPLRGPQLATCEVWLVFEGLCGGASRDLQALWPRLAERLDPARRRRLESAFPSLGLELSPAP